MRADDPRHGTEAGHEQHRRDEETSCDACKRADILAARRRSKRKAMGYRYTVPSDPARARITAWMEGGATLGEIEDHTGIAGGRIWEIVHDGAPMIYARTHASVMRAGAWPVTTLGLRRRIHALCALGYSAAAIAQACDIHLDSVIDIRRRRPEFTARRVRNGIVAGYGLLANRAPQPISERDRAGVTRVRNHAARMGWLPPLAWDDIDDPNERPDAGWREHPARQRPKATTIEDFDWLVSQGESPEQAAARLGVTVHAVRDYRRAMERVA